jgi:hypothetical protein
MIKLLKTLFFTVLLVGAGAIIGWMCNEIHSAYQLILFPSVDLLILILKFLLASGFLLIAAGLVGVLLRPIWVGIIAFCLSGLAMLLCWQVTITNLVLILIYVLAGTFYTIGLVRELKERIRFTVRSVSVGQNLLAMSLAVVACGGIYLGFKDYINQEGFSIPEPYLVIMMEQFEKQIDIPETDEGYESAIAEFREGFRRNIQNLMNEKIAPYEDFIPLIIAAGLFMSLVTIIGLFSWITNGILGLIFPLLLALHATKIVSQTEEVTRMVLA